MRWAAALAAAFDAVNVTLFKLLPIKPGLGLAMVEEEEEEVALKEAPGRASSRSLLLGFVFRFFAFIESS